MTIKKKRGFAAMPVKLRREIAARGGRRSHELGVAYRWTSKEATKAAKKSRKSKLT